MTIPIHRLLDGLEDCSVPMEEQRVVSARKIKELTIMKIEQENPAPRRAVRKRVLTLALAAALILALGISAYAAWSIHESRQQELREDLQIEENRADSYVEYALPDASGDGLVLLSALNDGIDQRAYVDISPVTEEEAAGFPNDTFFTWSIAGTEIGGFAAPQLPVGQSVSGEAEIRKAVLAFAYDEQTQTLTLQCYMNVSLLRSAMEQLGSESVPLQINMGAKGESRSFGPISFSMTEEQRRVFDFGHARYYDEELDKEIELLSLELTPFSAVWLVRYDAAEDFHQSGADWEQYKDWSLLEDKICLQSALVFSDGSRFSTGGVLAAPYEDGAVHLNCAWGGAINIYEVRQIVLGDLILWQDD